MARIAVVAGPDPGHALPALGIARMLAAGGHRIRVLSGDGHDDTAAAHGLRLDRLPLLAPTPRDRDLGYRLWGRAAAMAPPVAEMLAPWRPDLVVADVLTRAGQFAAGLLGVPWVELTPHHLDEPDEALPPVGLGRRPASHLLRHLDDRRILTAQRRSIARGAVQAMEAARSIGLPGAAAPACRLVASLPALEYPRSRWPADVHLIGPVALDPALPSVEPPDGDGPLVVVTDSTASGVSTSLGAMALAAFRHLPLRLVVTSTTLPARRRPGLVVGPAPHLPLLDHASLAIGSGGAGFAGKAVRAGVPQVLVPVQGDQFEGAARLAWQGAGRVVRGRLTPRRLRWAAVTHLADRSAARAACRLAREAAALDSGAVLAAVGSVLADRR